MAAQKVFEPHEIPRLEKIRHTWYSVAGQSQLEDVSWVDESTRYLLDKTGMTLDGFDLKKMFEDYEPQQLIQVIGQHGVMLLGEMNIDEFLVQREFKGRTTLTVGKDDMHMTDWETMWMTELMGGGKRYTPERENELVKVEAFVVTIRNAAGVRQNGLLHPLIKRWEADACPIEVWGLATVRALVSYKWNHWARHYVAIQFGVYMCWVVSFIVLATTFKLSDSDDLGNKSSPTTSLNGSGDDHDDPSDAGRWFLIVLTQLLMFPFTYLLVSRMVSAAWQWFNFWDVIDILTQGLQVICTMAFVIDQWPHRFNIILGTQTILLVTKIQFYARAFVAVDSSLLDTLKAVVGSLRLYLLRLVLIICSFACALFILFRGRYRECDDFKDIVHSGMTMFALMLGEWEVTDYLTIPPAFNETDFNKTYFKTYGGPPPSDLTHYQEEYDTNKGDAEPSSCLWIDFCDSSVPSCANSEWGDYRPNLEVSSIIFFLCLYMIAMSVLFYHLLIAMVIDSHARQMEIRKLWVHLSRAEIINILENALPRRMTEKYSYAYIHVLRVIPRRGANLDKIWEQASETETAAERSAEQVESNLRNIEADILSRIEGLSERIRITVGMPEEDYRSYVFRKMGISQMRSMARQGSFTLSARSSKRLLPGQH